MIRVLGFLFSECAFVAFVNYFPKLDIRLLFTTMESLEHNKNFHNSLVSAAIARLFASHKVRFLLSLNESALSWLEL